MTDYKPGDRVRVSFKSDITEVTDKGFLVVLDPDRDRHYVTQGQGWTIEKLTPDYKAQIEALEPGTAFEVSLGNIRAVYLRVNADQVVTPFGTTYTVAKLLDVIGRLDAIRILK